MNTINFEYQGKEYRLGFNRRSVEQLEAQGFSIDRLGDMPVSQIPRFFYGSFQMNHRGIKRKYVDEIWEKIGNKNDLIIKLGELYAETIEDLMGTGEESEGEAIAWAASN